MAYTEGFKAFLKVAKELNCKTMDELHDALYDKRLKNVTVTGGDFESVKDRLKIKRF